MSRKRKRLESFSENVRKRKSRQSTGEGTSIKLSNKEKVVVLGFPLCVIFGFLVLVCYGALKRGRQHAEAGIEKRIEKWRVEHNLTEEEVGRIREIETEFHADGISALLGTEPSDEEKSLHKETIDGLLKK